MTMKLEASQFFPGKKYVILKDKELFIYYKVLRRHLFMYLYFLDFY